MALQRAHVVLVVLCLALCSSQVSCWSLRSLLTFGNACALPVDQDQKPATPGPYDTASEYLCFGFQFTSTHEPTPIITWLRDLYNFNSNPLLNPYLLLNAASDDAPILEDYNVSRPLYYPLDGAFGSGANGTGYGGAPYKKSSTVGKYTYAVGWQLRDFSDTGVTYPVVNKVLANLGKRLKRFFPIGGAVKRRPGVVEFEITTFWNRQDPKFNGASATFNFTTVDNPAGTIVVKGCKYP